MADTVELLRKTSDILAERGWHQGDLLDPKTGAVCLMGAAALASGAMVAHDVIVGIVGHPEVEEALNLVDDALGEPLDLSYVAFNDDPSTTYEDVQLHIKHAIELVESEAVG